MVLSRDGALQDSRGYVTNPDMNSHTQTTGKARVRFTCADYPVLGVLSLAPVHGYDVWRYLKSNLGNVWHMKRSQVYGLLSQMEREGLVSHERVDQINLPARKVFSLTAQGQETFDRWIREPVRNVRDFRLEFPTKFHFARARSPAVARELIENQVRVCQSKRLELDKARACSASEVERHVVAYRIGIVDATVKWLKDLLEAEPSSEAEN